jgi:hypothetical protein
MRRGNHEIGGVWHMDRTVTYSALYNSELLLYGVFASEGRKLADETAALIGSAAVRAYVKNRLKAAPAAEEALGGSLLAAHRKLCERRREKLQQSPEDAAPTASGSIVQILTNGRAVYAYTGRTHAYHLYKKLGIRGSINHVNEIIPGQDTPATISRLGQLGHDPVIRTGTLDLREGDRLLWCTDNPTRHLSNNEVLTALIAGSMESAMHALFDPRQPKDDTAAVLLQVYS